MIFVKWKEKVTRNPPPLPQVWISDSLWPQVDEQNYWPLIYRDYSGNQWVVTTFLGIRYVASCQCEVNHHFVQAADSSKKLSTHIQTPGSILLI